MVTISISQETRFSETEKITCVEVSKTGEMDFKEMEVNTLKILKDAKDSAIEPLREKQKEAVEAEIDEV